MYWPKKGIFEEGPKGVPPLISVYTDYQHCSVRSPNIESVSASWMISKSACPKPFSDLSP